MLSERLALRRDLKIVCNIPLTEYRLDVVSTRSRHVLASGWPQPILTTVRKTQRQPLRAPFDTTQESPFSNNTSWPSMQLGLFLDDNPAVSLLTLCFGWLLTLPKSIEIRIPKAKYFCPKRPLWHSLSLTFVWHIPNLPSATLQRQSPKLNNKEEAIQTLSVAYIQRS
jgi:hypothetical protein